MSPIIDLQRRLHEAGRIRIGEQVATGQKGKTRPNKLESFRFTSQSEDAIRAIAGVYGGPPRPWSDAPAGKQWEVVTEADHVRVLVPPESMAFSQFYELWSGGGCQRRCDGARQLLVDADCACDPEGRECKPHTRISMMLAEMPSSGLWRLDTQGFYAAVELSGGFELANLISQASGRAVLGATLRLDQREVRRPGKITRKFAVPVIDFDVDVRALVGDTPMGLPGLVTPVPAIAAPSLADQLAEVDTPKERAQRSNAAEPIKPTGIKARPVAAVVSLPEEEEEAPGTAVAPAQPSPEDESLVDRIVRVSASASQDRVTEAFQTGALVACLTRKGQAWIVEREKIAHAPQDRLQAVADYLKLTA